MTCAPTRDELQDERRRAEAAEVARREAEAARDAARDEARRVEERRDAPAEDILGKTIAALQQVLPHVCSS